VFEPVFSPGQLKTSRFLAVILVPKFVCHYDCLQKSAQGSARVERRVEWREVKENYGRFFAPKGDRTQPSVLTGFNPGNDVMTMSPEGAREPRRR
jgi:hypothetical protein